MMGLIKTFLGYFAVDPRYEKRSVRRVQATPQSARSASLLKGDGSFEFEVVGESHYQNALDKICGGHCFEGVNHECVAILLLEDDNPYDPNAVGVFVDTLKVGHLPREIAHIYRRDVSRLGLNGAAVGARALIRGGWDRGGGDVGSFGIWLDVHQPLSIEASL